MRKTASERCDDSPRVSILLPTTAERVCCNWRTRGPRGDLWRGKFIYRENGLIVISGILLILDALRGYRGNAARRRFFDASIVTVDDDVF